MPNLSKKKGRRRFNPDREAAKAQRILEKHKTDKFLQNQSQSGQPWQFDHLTQNQAMTGADKLFHKKVIKVSKARNLSLADHTNHSNNKNDRNLTSFESEQIHTHQIRAINDNSDIDPSDSDLETEKHLRTINDNDEIFTFRRNKAQTNNEELLESSGDDLSANYDSLLQTQNEDKTVDIDSQMDTDTVTPLDSDNLQNYVHKRRRNKAVNISAKQIQKQIMNDSNTENEKRLLNLSAKIAQNNNHSVLYDSDSSSYYDNGIGSGDESDSDSIAEEGVGNVHWGDKRKDYYGADGMHKWFKTKPFHQQKRQLRDEERIGLQMQKDEMVHQRYKDFVDLEMEQMMETEMENQCEMGKNVYKFKGEREAFSNIDSIIDDAKEMSIDKTEESDKAEIEVIIKTDKVGSNIIERDHSELQGMLSELKNVISELQSVSEWRLRAIQKRFDEAIEDSTLFIELLRTYSSTIAFYLQLKAKKCGESELKRHGIYGVLLQLKHRVTKFRRVYSKSVAFMRRLSAEWSRTEYRRQRRDLLAYEKERQKGICERRMRAESVERQRRKSDAKKLRKQRKREERMKKRLFQRGFNRLHNQNEKLEGEEERRSITQKIFKSQGLKRYRKQGIPRVKARIKYDKAMKRWKRKGYKPYTQKLPNGRMEYYINTNMTHSKRLT